MNRGFEKANRNRTAEAAPRQAAEAREAIEVVRHADPHGVRYGHLHEQHLTALIDRARMPHASLGEIAAVVGVTKHTYTGRLLRAFQYARRLEART